MRYIIIYAVLNPTPKGVGYDLDIHFTYFRSPKFIAPLRRKLPKIFELGNPTDPLDRGCVSRFISSPSHNVSPSFNV
ncbi:MAG: hypothetical protein IJQ39_00905 [Thermoguttaceae bacterium]|nr:hypothetical protein [Thermoguttaceae bacterium]